MTDVATLREALVERAVVGRQRAAKLLKDPDFDASREAAEGFIDALYDYFVARLVEEGHRHQGKGHNLTGPMLEDQ